MRGKYQMDRAEIDKDIEAFAKKYSTPQTEELLRQMITTMIKLHYDNANEFDLRMLNSALKELRHAFRIFQDYRDVPKVTVWGSARIKSNSEEYKMAMEFARIMAKNGFMIITGGGGGVMEAGNRGGGDKSFAVNISLPNRQKPNPYIVRGEKLIEFKYFFTRKLIFVKESNATVLFPGGFGTNDEAYEILTLYQTGKCMPRPIVLISSKKNRYWQSWLEFVKKELVSGGYIARSDLGLFRIVTTVDEAVKEIDDFYRVYHSLRSVGPQTVMRLHKEISPTAVKELNRTFSDLLIEGKIELCGPTAEEIKDKDHTRLPRLIFRFDRHSYGRLNEMIRSLNLYC